MPEGQDQERNSRNALIAGALALAALVAAPERNRDGFCQLTHPTCDEMRRWLEEEMDAIGDALREAMNS